MIASRGLPMQYMFIFFKYHGNKHIGGVSYSHTIKPTNHIYNTCHTHQTLSDNDNGYCDIYLWELQRPRDENNAPQSANPFPFMARVQLSSTTKKSIHYSHSLQGRET